MEATDNTPKQEDWSSWHGHRGKQTWPLPKLVARSDKPNREDQKNMIKANEYLDDKDVLDAKLQIVADLLKASKHCVTYTGAGLSRASGIPDYATKSKESIVAGPKIKSSFDAQPTYAHIVLTSLEKAGYLKHWVQQNHDGLPQKAGFPQEKINEIHGAWYDPSNPVVQFSGSLRTDLFKWMVEWEEKADLCLCLGTSLSGMNADRMANTPAKKSLKNKALGTILVNLQQTPLDGKCAIRIWAKLDDAFKILSDKLQLNVKPNVITLPEGDVFYVPYNADGKKDEYCKMTLDLRIGAEVKIVVQGAMNEGAKGQVVEKREDGHYSVRLYEKITAVRRLLGNWWIDSALKGTVSQLPLVNVSPQVEKLSKPFVYQQPDVVKTDATVSLTSSLDSMDIQDDEVKEKKKDKKKTEEVKKDQKTLKIIQSHFRMEGEETDNKHKWSLRLEDGAESFVSEVIYSLHPTFHQREIVCKEAPFSIARIGWGTFHVGVIITLKSGQKIQAVHKLSFKETGDQVRVTEVALSS